MPAVPDIPAILGALTRHGCRFVVIGGFAVAYHGHVRATRDVDVVPDPREDNLRMLWDALLELKARPLAIGDLDPKELPVAWSLDSLLHRGNWDLATDRGRIDILQFVAGKIETAEDYDALAERAEAADIGFGPVLMVGYDDLIDFKTLASRDQDLTDIRALREARGDTSSR